MLLDQSQCLAKTGQESYVSGQVGHGDHAAMCTGHDQRKGAACLMDRKDH